jgi:predicted regulator of Ras-like GTPase activity (Roadblock/LC7/MglB family)
MQNILTSLKDIPGVVGSFVLNPQGALLAKEMPTVYPTAIFPEMGRRLVSVGEVLEQQTATFQELLLKFEGSWLFVRRTTQCLLSVLVAETVNYPALRMATNVALKQLNDQILAHPAPAVIAEPAVEPQSLAAVPAPTAAEAPAAPVKARRMWRGQVVD